MPQSAFITPMMAVPVRKLPNSVDWCYEIKLDGFRCIAAKGKDRARLYSRRGNSLTGRYPHIAEALADGLPRDTVLDGEIVALNDRGLPSFNLLQNDAGGIVFYAFDVLMERGRSLLTQPYQERRAILEARISPKVPRPVLFSHSFGCDARLVNRARRLGLEGIVAKRRDSIYVPGKRSTSWAKFKMNKSQEFVIAGYTPGDHGLDALVLGYYDGKKLVYAGKCRNGFIPLTRRQVAARFLKLAAIRCPFGEIKITRSAWNEGLTREDLARMCWLKPQLVAQIEFLAWTNTGYLRHSKFVGLREDKDPREVVRENGGLEKMTTDQFYKGYRIAAILYPTPVERWIPHGAIFKKQADGSERELRVSGSVALAFEDKAQAEDFAFQMCRTGIDRMR